MRLNVNTYAALVRLVGILGMSALLMAASFVPREAMLVRDPASGKVHISPCPTRGPAYFTTMQSRTPGMNMSQAHHRRDNSDHHRHKKTNTPPSCPQDRAAPLVPLTFTPVLIIPLRLVLPVRYEVGLTTPFLGQTPIRQANRDPPTLSVFL
ncbi:MAG TPA: hypothetical protein ENK01_03585 [Hellea balneolensis]|uniref:DUF2946 domain-containing protein n=1 Tax=Hellea balneolensis TaxID=287478 RepID=A0A7V5NXQ6_9PROT|nr:hypothetical protein [Hellea balneolensis]